jgi:hypothetical protein
MSLREPRGRLARWMVEVQEFDYEISHVPGSSLVVPDCLSRDTFEDKRPKCPRCDDEVVKSVRDLCSLPSIIEVLEEQRKELGDLDEYVRDHEGYLRDEDGLVCLEGPVKTNVCVPKSLRGQVLEYMPGSTNSGHYDIAKKCKRVGSRFWWANYRKGVDEKVKSCLSCELAWATPPRRQDRTVEYHPTKRFEIVAVDVMEVSPKSERGNTKVVVIGDTFTRFAWHTLCQMRSLRLLL